MPSSKRTYAWVATFILIFLRKKLFTYVIIYQNVPIRFLRNRLMSYVESHYHNHMSINNVYRNQTLLNQIVGRTITQRNPSTARVKLYSTSLCMQGQPLSVSVSKNLKFRWLFYIFLSEVRLRYKAVFFFRFFCVVP